MLYSAVITSVCFSPQYQGRMDFLKMALQSVLNQSLPPQEIIIVYEKSLKPSPASYPQQDDGKKANDGDMENSAELPADIQEMIAKHKIKLIANQGSGISAARNTGINQSASPWLAFLDDDDEWLPNKIKRQADLIAKLTKEGKCPLLCHTDEKWLLNGERLNPHLKHKKSGGRIYENCLELCCISPSTVLISRELFTNYGLFDEKMPVCEDYDMWLRVCAYEDIAFVKEKLAIKKGGHKDQLSHKYWGMDRFRCYALSKMLADPLLDAEYRKATKDNLLKRWQILSIGAQKRGKEQHLNYYQNQIKQLHSNNV